MSRAAGTLVPPRAPPQLHREAPQQPRGSPGQRSQCQSAQDAAEEQRFPDVVQAVLEPRDAPHLARLGLTLPAASATAPSDGAARGTRPRAKHTPELQSALNQATAKWAHLRRIGALPKERKVSSAVLWLAVLEPSARGRRLVDAMQIDPDGVRTAVLSAIVPTGAAIPTWPTEAPVGPATRFTHWVFGHLNLPR